MRISRVRRVVTTALLLAAVGSTALFLPAQADPNDRLEEIRRRQAELQRKIDAATARKGELLDKIAIVDTERAKVDKVVTSLDAELAALNEDIQVVTDRLTVTQQRLAVLHNDLEAILGRLVSRTDVFTERAIAAYKAGPTAYLDSLMSSESFGELTERYTMYEAVLAADSEMVEEIEALRSETESRRAEVEEKEEQIAADKRKLEADRARVAAIRAERAGALADLEAVLRTKRSLLTEVESKKSHYEKIQDQLEQESDEIQNLLAGGSTVPSYGGGQFAWPAAGSVTSPYGMRIHPIFGTARMHTGVDIGAAYGSTVVAGERGVVAYAGVMSGYGNVIVVDHGGGIATTYNHLSGFSVSSGQSVGRGQPVGAVGCTGYCTGPHLHFEVRINGAPVDPMPYLQ